jgi:phosphatidylethanolamine/phosphatidyl-N-methylethanolamine N-methyltransferase
MATLAKKLRSAFTDTTMFVQEWLANPQGIGAVAPSSKNLVVAMAKWLPTDPDSYVLELGPGTGVVTEALIEHGLRQDRLVAIEQNSKMARLLKEKFPRAQIITGDAWKLDDLLRRRREPVEKVGAVISSLPLLNFPRAEAEKLADKIRDVLEPHGNWVQFTYRIHRLRPRGTTSFQLKASKVVWFNLPPARVSVFQK